MRYVKQLLQNIAAVRGLHLFAFTEKLCETIVCFLFLVKAYVAIMDEMLQSRKIKEPKTQSQLIMSTRTILKKPKVKKNPLKFHLQTLYLFEQLGPLVVGLWYVTRHCFMQL